MSNIAVQTGHELAQYKAGGIDITLTPDIVRSIICKGAKVDDSEVIKFMHLCHANRLNPFTGEVYLLPFGGSAQLTVSKEAYFKRAEAHDQYDGIESGIIVLRNGQIEDIEGTFHLPTDQLVGAWARVYRKDRKVPLLSRVSMAEYDGKRNLWASKPATMICKVAKVHALREAFPTLVQGMYIEEELSEVVGHRVVTQPEAVAQPTPIDYDGIEARISAATSLEEIKTIFWSLSETEQNDQRIKDKCAIRKAELENQAQEVQYQDI